MTIKFKNHQDICDQNMVSYVKCIVGIYWYNIAIGEINSFFTDWEDWVDGCFSILI